MELLKYLIEEWDYSDCKSLIDVAACVRCAIDDLDIRPEDTLDMIQSELKLQSIDDLFKSFAELEDGERLSSALLDVLHFEELLGKYYVDLSDVLVGLMQARATPELSDHLKALPFSTRAY